MAISERTEQVIKQFLVGWWGDLSWQVRETMLGVEIPPQTDKALYDSGFGLVLRQMANAAEGQAPDTDQERGEVYECCQQVAEWMWARPGMPSSYQIPPAFWQSDIGNLCLRALVWAQQDELIRPSEAARMLGCDPSSVSQYLARGKLTRYEDNSEFNHQRRTRLRRSEVEQFKREIDAR